MAAALWERHEPTAPRLTTFRWRYYGREGNFGGEGALRVDPAGAARVDLLGAGSATVQVAVLAGERVELANEDPDVQLPPPSFLWAMAGVFRPPAQMPMRALGGEGETVLEYRVGVREELWFEFSRASRLRRVVYRRDGRAEQDLSLQWNGLTEIPSQAEFRDLREFRRIRLVVRGSRSPRRPPAASTRSRAAAACPGTSVPSPSCRSTTRRLSSPSPRRSPRRSSTR